MMISVSSAANRPHPSCGGSPFESINTLDLIIIIDHYCPNV